MGRHSALTARATADKALHPRQRAAPAGGDRLLVAIAAAMVLGLGAMVASLAPAPNDLHEVGWRRPPAIVAQSASCPCSSRGNLLQAHTAARRLDGVLTLAMASQRSTFGSSESPLYPKIGRTLWDRVLVSSPQDHRVYLIGTSIQVHARAAAVTAGNHPYPHGVD